MRRLLALMIFAAAGASAADYPAGYWDRAYAVYPQSSLTVVLTLKVPSISRAEIELDKRLTKAGATLTNMNSGYQGDGTNTRPAMKSITYTLDPRKVEAVAHALFDLGELQQYNVQKQNGPNNMDEINQKLKDLNEELTQNAAALKSMPISTSLLNGQITRLTQTKEQLENAQNKANLQITLSQPKEQEVTR